MNGDDFKIHERMLELEKLAASLVATLERIEKALDCMECKKAKAVNGE